MKEITKEKFVSIMEAIEKEYNYGSEVNKLLTQIFDEGQGYPKAICYNELVELLKYLFDDIDDYSTIDYYIYEIDFGKTWYEGCFTTINKESIDISNSEKLYEHLTRG